MAASSKTSTTNSTTPVTTRIDSAQIVAGHDGLPELVVTLRYSNGATATTTLENATGVKLLQQCGVHSAAELAGQPWTQLLLAVGMHR